MSGSVEMGIDPEIFNPYMFDINSFDHNNIIDPNIFVQNLNLTPDQLGQVLKIIKRLCVRVNYKINYTEDKIKDLTDSHASLNKTCINECPKCNNLLGMQSQISTLQSQLPNFSDQLKTLKQIERKIEERIPVAFKATQMAELAEVQANASDYIAELREQSELFDNNPSREGYDLARQTYAKLKPIFGKLNEQTQYKIVDEINPILTAMHKHLVEKQEQANQANPANPENNNQVNQATDQVNNQLTAGKKRSKSNKSKNSKKKSRKSRKSRKTKSRRH